MATDVDGDRARTKHMGEAEQERDVVEPGDALFGDDLGVFVLRRAHVEEKASAKPTSALLLSFETLAANSD